MQFFADLRFLRKRDVGWKYLEVGQTSLLLISCHDIIKKCGTRPLQSEGLSVSRIPLTFNPFSRIMPTRRGILSTCEIGKLRAGKWESLTCLVCMKKKKIKMDDGNPIISGPL